MVYAVQAEVGFRNATRRDAVFSTVQTRLAQEVKWGDTTVLKVTNLAGDLAISVEVRFTTDAARDSFWTDVVAFMGTGLNGPTTGSFIQQHDCPHDGASPQPCVVSDRIDYA